MGETLDEFSSCIIRGAEEHAPEFQINSNYYRSIRSLLASCRLRHHPLGFVYGTQRLQSGLDFRVHVWANNFPKHSDGHIHSHDWHLWSIVLAGTLRNIVYSISSSTEGGAVLAPVEYDDCQRGIINSSSSVSVNCNPVLIHTLEKNALYSMSPGVFHRSVLVSESAVTCVVARPAVDVCPSVVCLGGDAGIDVFQRNDACRAEVLKTYDAVVTE